MGNICIRIWAITALSLVFAQPMHGQEAGAAAPDPFGWPMPSIENRPGCFWWWPGSAVDAQNITWNLEILREAGMGGVTIVPIYGVKGYESRYIPFLTPEWAGMMSHAVLEAKRLGMWVDMTPGTGWPFGGPMVSDGDCDATVVYEGGALSWKFSGRKVKRAAPGGEGKAINPYSPAAMSRYLKPFDAAFAAPGTALPRALYHDSFEFSGNWCADLPEEFAKRRGYDLREHLPALFGEGEPETVARVKCDYRETLSDLHLEYMETFAAWAASKGCTTRNQAHGSPSNLLDLYAAAGIPETETFGATAFEIPGVRPEEEAFLRDTPKPLINRMASSAAHVAGKRLVASESCTWVRDHFRTALSQVKPEIDQLFLTGINHIFFHGCCYSPQDAAWPGWLFYASLEYNPRNAIWHDAPFLNAYITRCQSILQSGEPDNNVLLYWPIYDLWQSPEGMQQMLTVHRTGWLDDSSCGKTAAWLVENGYGFDYVSDRQLAGRLPARYKAIVVPETEHMPEATLKSLLELQDGGVPVVFLEQLPTDVPGLNELASRRVELNALLEGRESLVCEAGALRQRLAGAGVAREPMVDGGLSFIRRMHDLGRHYFVANLSAKAADGWVALGAPFQSAVIMDPQSGAYGVAIQRNGKELYLQLLPGETRIIRTITGSEVQGPVWPVLREAMDAPFTIEGSWELTFSSGGPELPAPRTISKLGSWTELGDLKAESFAGTGRYSIEFELPASNADDWVIDLGDVRESARVSINGEFAAALWSAPCRAAVGTYLKPSRNRIEVDVTNLSANRIRDLDIRGVEWRIFHDINFVDKNYSKFDASKWPLTASGLLGPVRLIPMKRYSPS